jgi:activator of 2-hydroxyglutaryl-CoA dehydratase
VGIIEPLMTTGGVVKNIGAVQAYEQKAGYPVRVSPCARVNGAIGAVLIAARYWRCRKERNQV